MYYYYYVWVDTALILINYNKWYQRNSLQIFFILTWLIVCHITIFCLYLNEAFQINLNQQYNQKCLSIDSELGDLWCHNFCCKLKVCNKIKSLSHVAWLMLKLCIDSIKKGTKPTAQWFITCFWIKNGISSVELYHFVHWNYSSKFNPNCILWLKSTLISTIFCG